MALIAFIVLILCFFEHSAGAELKQTETNSTGIIGQGRTLVHHAVKRLMVILPLVFFKLGIAFTLLILVTIVSVNNGFIGFLLLVVGLSSVLARLQEARRPTTIPLIQSPYVSREDNLNLFERKDLSFLRQKRT